MKSPARSRRYEILLEFLCDIGCVTGDGSSARNDCGADYGSCAYLEKLREYLTIDYYLREKPKSKPDFVKELPTLKFDYENRDPLTGNFLILP